MKKIIKRVLLVIGVLLVLFICYFFAIRRLDANAVEAKDFYTVASPTAGPVLLPSVFTDRQRFYLKMATTTGYTLLAFGDTGGGMSMVPSAVADRPGLQRLVKRGLLKGIMPMKYIPFRELAANPHIPPPVPLRSMILRHPFNRIQEPFLIVFPMDGELKFMTEHMFFDIFLGQNFFMGKAWTFDYLHQQIWVNTPLAASEAGQPGVQSLGFKKNKSGDNIFGHPSMTIEVNGEIIDVLFDTGASIVLSDEGKKIFGTTGKTIGGSFIAASLFNKWKKEHPDWKYYEKADMANDIIEVPVVKIGGFEAGPVLFAKRPDEVWSRDMIRTMDKVVKGAIGGSALQYFKVTADYNSGLIRFEQ